MLLCHSSAAQENCWRCAFRVKMERNLYANEMLIPHIKVKFNKTSLHWAHRNSAIPWLWLLAGFLLTQFPHLQRSLCKLCDLADKTKQRLPCSWSARGFYSCPLPFNAPNTSSTPESRLKIRIDRPEVSAACIAKSAKSRDSASPSRGWLLTRLGWDTAL